MLVWFLVSLLTQHEESMFISGINIFNIHTHRCLCSCKHRKHNLLLRASAGPTAASLHILTHSASPPLGGQ